MGRLLWEWLGTLTAWLITVVSLTVFGWVLVGVGRIREARLWRARLAVMQATADACQRCHVTHPGAVRYVGVALPPQREASR